MHLPFAFWYSTAPDENSMMWMRGLSHETWRTIQRAPRFDNKPEPGLTVFPHVSQSALYLFCLGMMFLVVNGKS
tara:strand:+ start:209 stop:430 length:222 start_codon:yes stop_codon:yes gene_type:complete